MKTKNLSALFLLIAGPIAALASPAEDRKIEASALGSYNYRAVLDNHVKVQANDGVVTLTGMVQDADEKTLAEETVNNLPSVTKVKNEIVVAPKFPEHSDGWIALKVRSRLLVKGSVSAATTKVDVKDGIVTLDGTAENNAQKELTEAYAKDIDWVKSVQNNIVVKEVAPTHSTLGEKIDDASITSQLKYALLRHKSTSSVHTKVVTTDGDIVISGEAASAAERDLVTKLAQDVRGVKSVKNGMTVKS